MSIEKRIKDYLRERRIHKLADDMKHARKLRDYGIAPPACSAACGARTPPACPRCGSGEVEQVSRWGSTPCKASYRCADCLEPFDYFKCI